MIISFPCKITSFSIQLYMGMNFFNSRWIIHSIQEFIFDLYMSSNFQLHESSGLKISKYSIKMLFNHFFTVVCKSWSIDKYYLWGLFNTSCFKCKEYGFLNQLSNFDLHWFKVHKGYCQIEVKVIKYYTGTLLKLLLPKRVC